MSCTRGRRPGCRAHPIRRTANIDPVRTVDSGPAPPNGPGPSGDAIEPVRGLARVTDMVDTLAAAGLTVERTQLGQARELPAVVDLAAYRLVQESLTNAHKHGTGTARLTISYTADAVVVDVVNPIAAGRVPTRSGYGMLGMRERAATAGGTLEAQPRPDGWFAVHAELPAPAPKTVTGQQT
ncbi:hypothetical protein ABZ345_06140 [Lentzea sp. NPDC005914]|uniref:sensor histidine kinase n=1 Tax=Lentzea sp. NPDC005914 TaxID=3154572 RepID=UPI00340AC0C0